MKLSEMVETTLTEIATGVRSAKEKNRDVMAIAPGTLNGNVVGGIDYIDFDISVVVEETEENITSKEKSGRGEIRVLSIASAFGSVAKKDEDNQSLASKMSHRISFKVPICMSTSGFKS